LGLFLNTTADLESADHEKLEADCQIRRFPLDLTIQREQIVNY
jgi:hypothetical protein